MSDALLARRVEGDEASKVFDLERSPGEECLATFWRQASPGTTYWRCAVPARYLPGQVLPFDFQTVDWDSETDRLIVPQQRGVAIWQFLGDDTRSRFAFALQDQGVPTLMEMDDDYTVLPRKMPGQSVRPWEKTMEAADRSRVGYSTEAHVQLVEQTDALIVSTPHLAQVYGELHDNIFVCLNSIDPDDWTDIPRHDDGVFRIGYYGSPSHLHDYPLVKKALKWASRQPGVEVMAIGFKPPAFPGVIAPWTNDLAVARRQLGLLDVGVAPLQPYPWSLGKSDVKALEYAIAGVMPLVSRIAPYDPWEEPFAVDDWYAAIKWAVKNQDAVREHAAQAKTYVLEQRTIQSNIYLWEEAIREASRTVNG